jgi:hypothetical protein
VTTRIAYNAESASGQQVAEFVDSVMTALAKGRRLKAQLDSMNSGEGGDSAAIEGEIGGMVAGRGADLWYIISTAMQTIDVGAIAELSRLDQG